MIPIGDDNSQRKTTPIVTYSLIIINVLVFLLEIIGGENFILDWAFIPTRFLDHPMANIPTLFTAMFMHSGWMHLIGNMLYLWIFGDNIEDHYGKIKYLIFYLLCGIAATFAQLVISSGSSLPQLGASGAIAGVLGAYIFLFPQEKVKVLLGRSITQVSALIVIGFWFLLQFMGGISSAATSADIGGVAYLAHIGGFAAGLSIALLFRLTDRKAS